MKGLDSVAHGKIDRAFVRFHVQRSDLRAQGDITGSVDQGNEHQRLNTLRCAVRFPLLNFLERLFSVECGGNSRYSAIIRISRYEPQAEQIE